MGLQDVAILPARACFSDTFPKNCGRGESFVNTTCLNTVVWEGKGMLPVKYFCSNKACSLCVNKMP